jgi:hypothetical protein
VLLVDVRLLPRVCYFPFDDGDHYSFKEREREREREEGRKKKMPVVL